MLRLIELSLTKIIDTNKLDGISPSLSKANCMRIPPRVYVISRISNCLSTGDTWVPFSRSFFDHKMSDLNQISGTNDIFETLKVRLVPEI